MKLLNISISTELTCADIVNETQYSGGLNGTTLETKCKIYNNVGKLKCSSFTKGENCRNDYCFWLYREYRREG
jgi:hypothetical protein